MSGSTPYSMLPLPHPLDGCGLIRCLVSQSSRWCPGALSQQSRKEASCRVPNPPPGGSLGPCHLEQMAFPISLALLVLSLAGFPAPGQARVREASGVVQSNGRLLIVGDDAPGVYWGLVNDPVRVWRPPRFWRCLRHGLRPRRWQSAARPGTCASADANIWPGSPSLRAWRDGVGRSRCG